MPRRPSQRYLTPAVARAPFSASSRLAMGVMPRRGDALCETGSACDEGETSRSTLQEILLEQDHAARFDPFTQAVLRRLGPTLDTFSAEQRRQLERAIYACRPLQQHPVDVRGVIPFFFWRFYYVFLMGRDRRRQTAKAENERRKKAGLVADTVFILAVLWQVFLVTVVVLYLVKSALGIDLMKDRHAWELLLD